MLTQYRFTGRSATLLSDEFEVALNAGHLRPGERLPSVRVLAAQLGVSPSTVSAAFAELRRRGLVVTRNRGASWVNERPPAGGLAAPIVVPAGVVDLANGNPDPELLPPLAPVLQTESAGWVRRLYGDDSSLSILTNAVVERLKATNARGEPGTPSCKSVVVSGAMDGIERALTAVLTRPSRIAVEDPGYDTLIGLIRALGHELVPVQVDEDGPTVASVRQALHSGIEALIVTSRAQNPTGAALDGTRASALAEALLDHAGVLVIENDHLGETAGAPLHSLAGTTDHWVYVHSFAKSLGPDLRVAVAVGDGRTIDRVAGRQALGPGWVSEILQKTVAAMLDDPAMDGVLNRARTAYGTRRQALADELANVGIKVWPGTGFNVWVPVPDEASVVAGLLTKGWAVAPGARYRLESRPGIRVTVSSMSPPEAKDFARDLALVLQDRPQRRA